MASVVRKAFRLPRKVNNYYDTPDFRYIEGHSAESFKQLRRLKKRYFWVEALRVRDPKFNERCSELEKERRAGKINEQELKNQILKEVDHSLARERQRISLTHL